MQYCSCKKPIKVDLDPPYCMGCGNLMKESKLKRVLKAVVKEIKK